MANIERIKKIAEEIGVEGEVSVILNSVESLKQKNKTHIAFAGAENSGKSRIINAIAGKDVREPSLVSVEEKPLRVSFERGISDERFECVEIYNPAWNGEDVELFELKNTDILKGKELSPLMDEIDIVYYLVSAVQVFTSDDMIVIGALKDHAVKIILTKIDMVDEESREKVITYTSGICEKLGLEKPIITDVKVPDEISKTIRNSLPLVTELQEMKRKHYEGICERAVEVIKDAANKKLDEIEKNYESAVTSANNANDGLALKRKKIKNSIIEQGLVYAERFNDSSEFASVIARNLMESGEKTNYSEEWREKLRQKYVEPVLYEAFQKENNLMVTQMFVDCEKWLKTIGLSVDEQLKNEINRFNNISVDYIDVDISGTVKSAKGQGVDWNSATVTATITAAVVAGAIIFPIPKWATWAASIGAVAYGTGTVIADKNKNEAKMWRDNIKAYSKTIASSFHGYLKAYVCESYNTVADTVEDVISNAIVTVNKEEFEQTKDKYKSIIEELQ